MLSTVNVEHIKQRVLMGRLFGKLKSTEVIHTKLTLSFGEAVKNPFFVDHFGWFSLEFIDEDELENMVEGRPWFVRGQIFHLQRWMEDFKESGLISYLRNGYKGVNENGCSSPLETGLCGERRQRAANLPQLGCWFMVNKVFSDEPNMLSEGLIDLNLTLGDLDNDLIVCFP
ncbi:hypothetical protein C1H46_017996 [Malus baccata]|uniref:DUF4283 domain-containing protein n=1 Tax=Malus baccata TaxID=106549 RepID=A0A540MCQ2_MALBA|nr:hypothetical protein C1H46_017996 [Malus baccata]